MALTSYRAAVRAPAAERQAAALLVLVALRGVLPEAIQFVASGRPAVITTLFVVRQSESHSPTAAAVARLLDLAVLLVAIVALFHDREQRGARAGRATLAFAALTAVSAASLLLHGSKPSLSLVVLAFAALSLGLSPPSRSSAMKIGGAYSVLLASVSLLVALLIPSVGLLASGDSRFYLWGSRRLAGVLSHPNALALALAVGLVIVAELARTDRRWRVGLLTVGVALFGTASRTAVLAAAAALLARWATSKLTSRSQAGPWTLSLVGTALFSALPLAAIVPSYLTDNGRLFVWEFVRRHWAESPLLGHGPEAWTKLAAGRLGPTDFAFHAHNLWLDLLYTTGLLGLVAMVVLMVFWARESRIAAISGASSLGLALMLVFLVESQTEVPIYLLSIDNRVVTLLLALAVSSAASAPRAEARGTQRA